MSEELKDTQGEELQTPAEQPATPEGETKQTIGDLLGEDKGKPKEEPKTVGLDKFLEEKKARKALEKEIKDLRKLVEVGGTQEEVSESLAELAEEYPDVDPKFLNKLVKAIKTESTKEVEAKLKPFEEKERKQKLEAIFKRGFNEALEEVPEYSKVVNEDVIFKLSLLPENGQKTFVQLIVDTYSNALGGKRTMETTSPRGGKEPEALDVDRAKRDTEYFKEVMSNPKLKKEYNEALIARGL